MKRINKIDEVHLKLEKCVSCGFSVHKNSMPYCSYFNIKMTKKVYPGVECSQYKDSPIVVLKKVEY